MNGLILALRLLHIVGGAFWVGSITLAVFFIEPTAKTFGPMGEKFLAHALFRTRLMPILVSAATVAIGAGAALYWIDSGGLRMEWITTPTGLGFTVGGIAALAAYAIALLVLKPHFDQLAGLVSGRQTNEGSLEPALHASLDEKRVRRWSIAQVALLLFAVSAMATARYLP